MINYVEYINNIVDDLLVISPATVEHEGISSVVDVDEVLDTLREAHVNDVIGVFNHLHDLRQIRGAQIFIRELIDYLELDQQHPEHEQLSIWVAQHTHYT